MSSNLWLVVALQQQIVPSITHCNEPDPECDLDYVPLVGRQVTGLDYAQSNSFAFGGNNSVLIARRWV
jgi:3-oxoacyl-[acyl-carrier-protein] synthase II